MKKVLKITACILLCILVILGWFIYKNWNTVQGVIDGLRYSQEDMELQAEKNKQELQSFLDENESITVRDLNEDEKAALKNGEITEVEAVALITGRITLEELKASKAETPPEQQEQPLPEEQTQSGEQTTNVAGAEQPTVQQQAPPAVAGTAVTEPVREKTSDEIVSELIANLYVQKSVYLSKLDGLESELGAAFEAVPKENKKEEKARIIAQYTPIIAAWETECDGVVYGILDQIEAELDKAGKDKTVVSKIDEAYKNEKRLKKAYYVNNYMS